MASSFEETLVTATARGSNIVNGVVLSAIDSHNEQIYHKTAGYNGLSSSAPPVAEDATFWLASCTKLATSIAALQCVERGLISLDEAVENILPELVDMQIASIEEGENLKLRPATMKLTLRHLLTHTSGFAYEWATPSLMEWRKKVPHRTYPTGTVTTLYNTPLIFEPGSGWVYGPGIDWAGILVERLNNGTTLGEYLHENIFARLNSKGENTTFRLQSASAKAARTKERLLLNVHRQHDGTLTEQSYGFSESVKEDSGGAGWYSTVGDFMIILQDLIAPEPKLLKKENLETWLFEAHIHDTLAIRQLLEARTGMIPQEGDAIHGTPINHSLAGLLWLQDSDVLPRGTLTWVSLPTSYLLFLPLPPPTTKITSTDENMCLGRSPEFEMVRESR